MPPPSPPVLLSPPPILPQRLAAALAQAKLDVGGDARERAQDELSLALLPGNEPVKGERGLALTFAEAKAAQALALHEATYMAVRFDTNDEERRALRFSRTLLSATRLGVDVYPHLCPLQDLDLRLVIEAALEEEKAAELAHRTVAIEAAVRKACLPAPTRALPPSAPTLPFLCRPSFPSLSHFRASAPASTLSSRASSSALSCGRSQPPAPPVV